MVTCVVVAPILLFEMLQVSTLIQTPDSFIDVKTTRHFRFITHAWLQFLFSLFFLRKVFLEKKLRDPIWFTRKNKNNF